jgi:hypothetical protein
MVLDQALVFLHQRLFAFIGGSILSISSLALLASLAVTLQLTNKKTGEAQGPAGL